MAEPSKAEQAKPLAPLSHTTRSDQPDDKLSSSDHPKRHNCIAFCGLIAAFSLLISVTFIILALTVFHVVNPTVTFDSLTFIRRLEIVNGTIRTDRNATVLVGVLVRNPNAASFRVRDVTTVVYYGGVVIGEGRRDSPGKAPAKRTVSMNLTVEIFTRNLSSVPSLREDLYGREMNMSSYIRVVGKVKMMKIFKKSVHLKRDCTMKYNTSEPNFQDLTCQKHVEI